jgi:hypothetical protein
MTSELDLFVFFLLDSFHHSVPGFESFTESHFKLDTLAERERVVRFLFSVRHAAEQLNCFELNVRAIDRMVKHMLRTNASSECVWPWAIDDFSRQLYTNPLWRANSAASRASPLAHALLTGKHDWQHRLAQMKFCTNELTVRRNELRERLEAAREAVDAPAAVAAAVTPERSHQLAASKSGGARQSRLQSMTSSTGDAGSAGSGSPFMMRQRRSRSVGKRATTSAVTSKSGGK